MGNTKYEHFSAVWKNNAGWFGTDDVKTLTNEDGVYRLYLVEQKDNTPKAIKISLGRDSNGNEAYYWIEYRTDDSNVSTFDRTKEVEIRLYYTPFTIVNSNDTGRKYNTLRFKTDANNFYNVSSSGGFTDKYRGVKVEQISEVVDGVNSYVDLQIDLPDLQADPIIADYGYIQDTNTRTETITLTNTGSSLIDISTISLTGDGADQYRILDDRCSNITLRAGDSCQIQVAIVPTQEGIQLAYLSIESNDPDNPNKYVELAAYVEFTTDDTTDTDTGDSGGAKTCTFATTAKGSYLEQYLADVRKFRDEKLMTNPIGRQIVKLYYKVSPPIAQYIDKHETARTVVRYILTPVVLAVAYHDKIPTHIALLVALPLVFQLRRKVR